MAIIRSVRYLTNKYDDNFTETPDTAEEISPVFFSETSADEGDVCCCSDWVDSFSINVSMLPVEISSVASVEMVEEGRIIDKFRLYDSPKIDVNSIVKARNLCCSKLILNFEKSGCFVIDGNQYEFYGENFDSFQMDISSNSIYEKEFVVQSADKKITTQNCSRIFAYGGLFYNNIHPKQIESCLFRVVKVGSEMKLRISPLSYYAKYGVDIFNKDVSQDASNYNRLHRLSLYDELCFGFCKIRILNKITNEIAVFKSNGVTHVNGTNLITINFIKEEL